MVSLEQFWYISLLCQLLISKSLNTDQVFVSLSCFVSFFLSRMVLGIESSYLLGKQSITVSHISPIFTFFISRVLLSCLSWPQTCHPPVSATRVAGIIGMHHLAQPEITYFWWKYAPQIYMYYTSKNTLDFKDLI